MTTSFRCGDPKCRESCVELGGTWFHDVDKTPACSDPVRVECTPDRASYTGREWRLMEARQTARAEASAAAAKLATGEKHCSECRRGLEVEIRGALETAWENALDFAVDEFARPHPVAA